MGEAEVSGPTLLLIRLSVARAIPGLPVAHEQQRRLEEELAFVQSVLAQNPRCDATQVSGDELRAQFSDSASAFTAAGELQQICNQTGASPSLSHLHMLLVRPDGDGDPAIPEAGSQMIRSLPPDWLFATEAVIGRLADPLRARFHPCGNCSDDAVDVSGLYRAIVHEDATTRVALAVRARAASVTGPSLALRWRDRTFTLRRESPPLALGRSEQADVQIDYDLASRLHARIVAEYNDFILSDQSTNGTFIRMGEAAEICLQHQQIVLREEGVISLGRPISQGRGKLIYFSVNA